MTENQQRKGAKDRTMKIRWNRLNRGIILAVLLAGGLTVYVASQNIRFNHEIPEIQQRAEQLGKELAETNIGSGEAVRRNQRAFVQNNFTSAESGSSSMMNEMMGMSVKKSGALYMLNAPLDAEGEIKSVKYEQISSSVAKSGVNGANVSIDYKVSYEYTGDTEIFGFNGMEYTDSMFWVEGMDTEDETETDRVKILNVEASVDLYMVPDDGEWKIVSMSNDGMETVTGEYADEQGGEPVG